MSADIVEFPPRARVHGAHPHARETLPRPPRGELMKWHDADFQGLPGDWVVDWWAGSEDSVCMMGRFSTEAEADDYINRWIRQHPLGPGDAA